MFLATASRQRQFYQPSSAGPFAPASPPQVHPLFPLISSVMYLFFQVWLGENICFCFCSSFGICLGAIFVHPLTYETVGLRHLREQRPRFLFGRQFERSFLIQLLVIEYSCQGQDCECVHVGTEPTRSILQGRCPPSHCCALCLWCYCRARLKRNPVFIMHFDLYLMFHCSYHVHHPVSCLHFSMRPPTTFFTKLLQAGPTLYFKIL